LLRAARFEAKLGVEPDEATADPISKLSRLLGDVPPARLFEEVNKLFLTGHGMRSMEALQRFGLSQAMFPVLPRGSGKGKVRISVMLRKTLENTDQRVKRDLPVTPAFLFAALLWQPVRERADRLVEGGETEYMAILNASEQVIFEQSRRTAVPRRFSAVTRQIWLMQARFAKTKGKRWKRLLYEQRFRAGYDFLLMRAEEDPELKQLCEFWTEAQKDFNATRPPDARRRGKKDRPRRRYRRRAPSAS
jgi:poly(A) polymerase